MAWAPDYVTAEGLRAYLRIDDAADDVFLSLWATAVSRNVDDFCGRQFGRTESLEARTFRGVWDSCALAYVIPVDDLQDLTGATVADRDGDLLDVEWEPLNALAKGRPYERLLAPSARVTITARWGWSAVPPAVPSGAYLQAARLSARRDSPFGVAGSPAEGSEVRLLAQLDPDFRTVLRPYVRKWWAA